jgi:allantoate deiminase
MVGSRLFCGELNAESAAPLVDPAGQSYLAAGAAHGVDRSKLDSDRLRSASMIGFIEVHVEQGTLLWNEDIRAACVAQIAGRRSYRCELHGAAADAGAISMRDRRDALAGAAEAMIALEKLANELGNNSTITVPLLLSRPNASNVVPDCVTFMIDFRSPMTTLLASGDQQINRMLQTIAHHRRLQLLLEVTETQTPVELDPRVCGKLRRSAGIRQIDPITDTTSGTLHDAAILAPHVPTAMLFIPSRDGVSHSPDEFTRVDDIAAAAAILMETVRDRRLE